MANVKFSNGMRIPLEMHKVRIVQKLNLPPVERRLEAISEAGFNTYMLSTSDIYMDMLTDSGVNAMSDLQQAAMLRADDAYAGSASFERLKERVVRIFGMPNFLPAHQGRACENIISACFVRDGDTVPMNYHFTTSKSHITIRGGKVEELVSDAGLQITSDLPFKGNMDIDKLRECIARVGVDRIPFVRMESGTNLIGGQPFSMANLREVSAVCREHGLRLILDASLLSDNLWFIHEREEAEKDRPLEDIVLETADLCDIVYFSARKLTCARGGGIVVRDETDFKVMRELVPLYEGFLTYGGMSVREMEAMAVGFDELMDLDNIGQGPQYIAHMVDRLLDRGVPVVTPAGGLGGHVDARAVLPHIPQTQYPAACLAAAVYISGAIRTMERGTLSEEREPDGSEPLADMELVRFAMPRRVYTLSQVEYAVDRIAWLYEHRELIGGLRWTEEPKVLRFFCGRLEPVTDWAADLVKAFRNDFGDSL